MCDICIDILKGFPKHTPQLCPFRQALHCSYCSIKGHSTKNCPSPPPSWATSAVFMEQFLPADIIKKHNITSKTLIPGCNLNEEPLVHEEDVLDTNRHLELWLKARSIQPAIKHKDKRLQAIEWGNLNNKKIIFISDGN